MIFMCVVYTTYMATSRGWSILGAKCYPDLMEPKANVYPHADSLAARMLSERLAVGAAERTMSTRKLAKLLKINQPSVISHMANGRLAIPVERAVPLAKALGLDPSIFLAAVLNQRFPSVDWGLLGSRGDNLADMNWVRALSGIDAAQLTAEQARVIGEVARDTNPAERWIEPSEIAYIRRLREGARKDEFGLTARDWEQEQEAIDRAIR